MRTVEYGIDKDGVECWFVLEKANLVGVYYTEAEALNNV